MTTKPLTTCMKGLFLLFNFVFWLTGLALLIVGILVKYAFNYMLKLSTGINYNLTPYILIGCGVFIILIGFMGCWASIKEHPWALKLYIFILIILFLVEVGVAIAGYVLRKKMAESLKEGMDKALKGYNNDTDEKSAMDQIQGKVKCCGVKSYKDYNTSKNCSTTTEILKVPATCCSVDLDKCAYKDICHPKVTGKLGIYEHGCYDELLSFAESKFYIIGGVALGIALFQILGIISAYILTKQFKETSRYETM